MEGTQKYFASNVESNLANTFQILRQKSSMFDVTLGCIDTCSGKINCISAHRVLLTAYSPVLSAICEESMHQNLQHTFIHLLGISNIDIFHLLNFMYNGEVELPLSEVKSFLQAANQLQVWGIADEDGLVVENILKLDENEPFLQPGENKNNVYKTNCSANQDNNIFAQPIIESEQENMTEQELICSEYSEMDLQIQSSPVSSKCLQGSIRPLPIQTDYNRPLPIQNGYEYSNRKIQEEIDSHLEGKSGNTESGNFDEPCFSKLGNKKNNEKRKFTAIKKKNSLMITKTQEGWECKTCLFSAKHKHTVRDHALRKHSAPEYIACHYCQKIYRDRAKFRTHIRNCSKSLEGEKNDGKF